MMIMNKSKIAYLVINLTVLLIAVSLFYFNYLKESYSFGVREILIIAIASVLVNVTKAFRLYFILLDSKFPSKLFIRQYCKTTLVSVLIPFKLGDIFRIYCYGYHLKSYSKSTVYIVLDRFFDTLALLVIVLVLLVTTHENFDLVVILLALFLGLITVVYILLPYVCSHLKHYYLTTKATPKTLSHLSLISKIEKVYVPVSNALRGKGVILCALSFVAWLLELGTVAILYGSTSSKFVDYLMAAFGMGESANYELFLLVTLTILLSVYAITQIAQTIRRHE